jgi:hypothetical protein
MRCTSQVLERVPESADGSQPRSGATDVTMPWRLSQDAPPLFARLMLTTFQAGSAVTLQSRARFRDLNVALEQYFEDDSDMKVRRGCPAVARQHASLAA